MNINFRLAVFGWQLGTFDINVSIDHPAVAAAAKPVVDGAVKRITRRWVKHMAA